MVDNKPGAGGTIGGALVAAAAPDGYTLMLSNTTPIALGPFTLEKQPYDPVDGVHAHRVSGRGAAGRDGQQAFGHQVATSTSRRKPERTASSTSAPAALARSATSTANCIKKSTGANMVHVPYRGGAPMTTDLIANTVPVGIDVITAYVQFFKSGQLVPLAVTGTSVRR